MYDGLESNPSYITVQTSRTYTDDYENIITIDYYMYCQNIGYQLSC